ncbi:hypothetical protein O6H91_22G040400 [Diphasiastrum complanatum]|uniref:Uncharacterized protein n=1 Tax=Diphasiastrum complanatum TaxID=34168 RepID=A0ACC2AF09_DIPCM|nr:hypothetical protein O6H91_22G040400 [Diphasiastrum complanatum]
MKISVKTLKGNHFDIDVSPSDTVIAVKKQIEDLQGREALPCSQQLLIHQGKVLKDETTMDDNTIIENSFLVVMLTKSKASTTQVSSSSSPTPPQVSAPAVPPPPAPAPGPVAPASPAGPGHAVPAAAGHSTIIPAPGTTAATSTGDIYGHAASNVVAGSVLEQTIQQLMELGSGSWDRDTIVRALRAAYNNPERAVEYLYSGIPESAEVAIPVSRPAVPASAEIGEVPVVPAVGAQAAPLGGPNAVPLDLFPQGMPGIAGAGGAVGTLDFLRNNPQFQALRTMVQVNPQILQPMLQELGKQNPQLLRLINENQAEFLRLINEPVAEGAEGDLLGNIGEAMPQTINVTPEEREAIDRLEAMGFDRALVIEAFLACDKNEQLAANYLLEHAAEFDE